MIPYQKCIAAKTWQLAASTTILALAIIAIIVFGTLKAFGYEIGSTAAGFPILIQIHNYQMDWVRICGNALQVTMGVWLIVNPIRALVYKRKIA